MSGCEGGSCSTCGGSDDPDRLPPGMLKAYDINQSVADGTLVWLELSGDSVADIGAELLGKARDMTEGRVFAVVFGGPEVKQLYPEIFGYGVDTLYHVRDESARVYRPEVYAETMAALCGRINPALVLIGATPRGREVAPRLAALTGSGLTADCTGLKADGRRIVMTRPAFGGTVVADIECVGFPQMATVRPGVFPRPERKEGKGTAIYWNASSSMVKTVISDEASEDSGSDIRDARILISLGDGIRERRLVDVAESVARKLGGQVSCSRALVERGWMPQSRQVGMSGRVVSPELYIAFGISGSVQHLAGMSGSAKVISVNNDPDAPIHRYSDISMIADAGRVLEEMDKSL